MTKEKERLPRETYSIGDNIILENREPLKGNDIAPPFPKRKKNYKVLRIELDSKGNQHLGVGLKSKVNFVRSYETGERLTGSGNTHYCHPSRFRKKVKRNK